MESLRAGAVYFFFHYRFNQSIKLKLCVTLSYLHAVCTWFQRWCGVGLHCCKPQTWCLESWMALVMPGHVSSYPPLVLRSMRLRNDLLCLVPLSSVAVNWWFATAGILEVLHCILIESPEALNIIQRGHIKSIISLLYKHGRNHKVSWNRRRSCIKYISMIKWIYWNYIVFVLILFIHHKSLTTVSYKAQ
jgi:hypothetical protein